MRWTPVLLLTVSVPLTGCAAVFGSKQKDFDLQSAPQGAEVYLDGNRLGTTPVKIKLSNQKGHTFVYKKEGYKDATCTLTKGTGAGWVILDVLGGLVPVVIDAATNSWSQTKGNSCSGNLEPIVAATH
jgi:PEGA domain